MEKPTIYASAPKPPKQIRVEENPVETNFEQQDLPENKQQPRSAITVMQPTAPKDTVVKFSQIATPVAEEKIEVVEDISPEINTEQEVSSAKLDAINEAVTTENADDMVLADSAENKAVIEEHPSKIEDVKPTPTGENLNGEPADVVIDTLEENNVEVKPNEQNVTVETPIANNNAPSGEITNDEETSTAEMLVHEITDTENALPIVDEKTELREIPTIVDNVIEEARSASSVKEHVADEQPVEAQESEPTIEEPAVKETKAIVEPKGEKGIKSHGSKHKVAETDYEFEDLKVPDDEELFQRQYYTMGEVATMFHANQSQIRFWENEFDILQPKKNKKGDRYFRPEDVKNLQVIHHLLRNRRFTIEGAREYLKSNKQRTHDTVSAIASLTQLKSFLVELKANL